MSAINFLKCLTVMDLSLSMKDVSKIGPQYDKWVLGAAPFLRKHGLLRDFTTVSGKFKKTGLEFTEDHGDELGAALKAKMPSFQADTSITHEQIALLKDLSLFMRKDSPSAWLRISKNVSLLNDNTLAAMFLDQDSNDVADMSIVQTMERIVMQLVKRKDDPMLSVNEVREFGATSPKIIAKYVELRKQFKANYSKALLKFVRLSGKPLVDVARAKAYLTAMGCNYLPTGFIGKVDEKGKLYTSAGKALKGTMAGRMQMNPSYDPKTDDTYYCKLLGDMRGELRTVDFLKHSKTLRIDSVTDFSSNIEEHRKTWLRDLGSIEKHTQMIAAIIETIHLTQARIGGEKNENDGVQTFGISTLRCKHIRVTAQGVEMRYPGKKGTLQHHTIKPTTATNRKVMSLLKSYIAGRGKEDRVFVAGGKPIIPSEVNGYLRRIGVKVTIHKFRHAAATKAALDLLASSPFNSKNKPTQAQAERWLKVEAIKIGTMLHHRTGSGDKQKVTGTTAIGAYISPDILKDFFVDLGLRVPKWIPEFEE
jgi:hypothetical protein